MKNKRLALCLIKRIYRGGNMNKYVIFTFRDEYDKKKLYYGSVHLKDNSIVIFSVKDNVKQYIDEFILEYENDKLSEFKHISRTLAATIVILASLLAVLLFFSQVLKYSSGIFR